MSNDTLRLSTAEREQASARLAEHFAEGRLDNDEYAERLDRIWAARTRGELRPVFRDLPGGTQPPAPAARALVRERRRRRRLPFPVVLLVALVVGAVVLTHPLVLLVGLAVWFVFLRGRSRPVWCHRRW